MSSGTSDKLEGKGDELKGNIKQGIGGATGDREMQSEGQADELEGKGKGVLGGAKDTLSKAGDAISDATGSSKK
ncbi:MAG TPA: CsbD family protein [Herpetosiphonaceae bacterium]|nr:CsbD family protein [Herpetosiphonaceae bacterium]